MSYFIFSEQLNNLLKIEIMLILFFIFLYVQNHKKLYNKYFLIYIFISLLTLFYSIDLAQSIISLITLATLFFSSSITVVHVMKDTNILKAFSICMKYLIIFIVVWILSSNIILTSTDVKYWHATQFAGFATNPNGSSFWFLIGIIIGIYYYLKTTKVILKILWIFFIFDSLYLLVMTASRMTFLALIFFVTTLLFIRKKYTILTLLIVSSIIFVMAYIDEILLFQRFFENTSSLESSSRFQWVIQFEWALNNNYGFGYGVGNFNPSNFISLPVDNSFYSIWLSGGWFALLVIVVIYLIPLMKINKYDFSNVEIQVSFAFYVSFIPMLLFGETLTSYQQFNIVIFLCLYSYLYHYRHKRLLYVKEK